jgi:hypothetical protein
MSRRDAVLTVVFIALLVAFLVAREWAANGG